MKTLMLSLLIALSFTSCCKVVYKTLGSTKDHDATTAESKELAKKMLAHFRNPTGGVSHAFEDQVQFVGIDRKAIKLLGKSKVGVNLIHAAYLPTNPDASLRNMPTIILQLVGKDNAYTYIDVKDLRYIRCKESKQPTQMSATDPIGICPPPRACRVPDLD